ncbi:MAG: hypothetical protein LBE56_00750 [Tannerella sp.]|jgi:hypothetical protein|nr:hypothetical protein [Tannerella sp.]
MSSVYKYLFYFFILTVVLYLPCFYLWKRRRDSQTTAYRRAHPDAVKVYLERTKLNDLLTVWKVNGAAPVLFSEGIRTGFYLLPGENSIDVAYQWTTVSITSLSGYETHTAENSHLTLFIEANKNYSLLYDHALKDYVFMEKHLTV